MQLKAMASSTDGYVTSADEVTVDKLTIRPNKAWEIIRVKRLHKAVPIKDRINPSIPVPLDHVRFVCISDTHSKIERKPLDTIPPGDVLIHAGDFTLEGNPVAVANFNTFLDKGLQNTKDDITRKLPHKHKIVIAGNHDLIFDDNFFEKGQLRHLGFDEKLYRGNMKKLNVNHAKELLTNCTYIQDELVDLFGIRIYGSPWQPEFHGWAFNVERGQKILDIWNKIPSCTDILITHGPPVGYGDVTTGGNNVGCVELLNTVQKRVKPKYHVFGHIHEGYGVFTDSYTTFINASICTTKYRPINPAILFDFPIPEGHTKDEAVKIITDDVWDRAHKQGTSTDIADVMFKTHL